MQAFSMYDVKDLDTTIQLLKTTYSFEDWDKMIELSDQLQVLAKSAYAFMQLDIDKSTLNMDRTIVYYIGFGHMAKGIAYQKKGLYEDARKSIANYSDWSWIKNPTEEEMKDIAFITSLSKTNNLVIELLTGNMDVLDEYVTFLLDNPTEILAGLITILESANIHGHNVDEALSNFPDEMRMLDGSDGLVNMSYTYKYFYQLAIYQRKRNRLQNSLDSILQGVTLADKMKNRGNFQECVKFYESLKEYASPHQDKIYNRILKGAIRHEKVIDISIASIRNS